MSTVALVGTTLAQSTSDAETYLDLTFSTPGTRDCGRGTTGEGNAVTFHVTHAPIAQTCINLNTTFSQGGNNTDGYTTGGYNCVGNTTCGLNYTLTGASGYVGNANYSQISYAQQNHSAADGGSNKAGKLFFQTYDGPGCVQAMHDDGRLRPWIRWNCNKPQGQCSTLPYGVVSFAIGPTKQMDQEGTCLVAAQYASGGVVAARTASSFAALVVAIFCGLVLGT
ncbi:Hypothetical predicted protein [Lecanosticta acicola]|uniref:Uncharacterized protein n=1 Tax=Lecanosticta acicola TaxID=111012 RepID=A0AAI8YV84_9PEZI|nr:Hypothetical predicted protein [Lecanosticta acicola]